MPEQLSRRETEVLELVASGCTRGEVSHRLYISPCTVKTHLEHIYIKLDVRSAAQAVATAFRRGVIQ